jgi:hypothetical protein
MTMMQRAPTRTSEREAFYDQNGASNKMPLWERQHGSLTARPTPRHRNFRLYLKTLGLVTIVGVSANLALPMAKAQAGGNFSLSCTNIHLNAVDFSKTAMLTADCKRMDQRDPNKAVHKGASINLNEIIMFDQNQQLQWARRPGGGDFQQSCSQDGLGLLGNPVGFAGHSELVATCNGGLKGIDLDGNITNEDGNLKYLGFDPPLKPGPR